MKKIYFLLLMAMGFSYNAVAQPTNDDCTGAVNQSLNAGASITFNGDNTGATDDGQGLATPQVWESFTTTECLDIVLDYCGTASVFGNAFLSLYDGCPYATFYGPDSWDQGVCLDSNWTIYYTDVPAGTWYYPVLTEPGSTGPYTINLAGVACTIDPPPANDECVDAIELTPTDPCSPITGSVSGATESLPPSECSTFTSSDALDVWFSFVASATDHEISVTGMGDLDAIVEYYEGTCAGLVSIDCIDGTIGGQTELLTASGLTIGSTYYVRVYAWNGGANDTDFEICITGVAPPPPVPGNNDCTNSVALSVYNQADCPGMSETGTTAGASLFGAEPACDATTGEFLDVWYTFNSGSNTEINVELNNIVATDLFIEVLDGCNGNSVYCEILAAPHVVPVSMGTDYSIRVFTNTQFGVGGAFDICLWGTASTVGIDETDGGSFEIYPNPASSYITLRNNGASVNASIELMDMSGKVVFGSERVFISDQDQVIDLYNIAPGVYMLSLTNFDGLEYRERLFIK